MKEPFALTVMMYHYIRDPGDTADSGSRITGMAVSAFEAQLDELTKQHTLVSWGDLRRALQGQSVLPTSPCLLTFDDGIRDHYLNAFRMLRSRNLSGLFFILDRSKEDGLVLGHKIHFLLAALGVDALWEVILAKLNVSERERFSQAETSYRLRYSSATQDGRIDLLKAILQRDLAPEVDPLLSDLFEKYVGAERETARSYYLNIEQMREMSAEGMHFGGHSRSHPWFDWIDATARTSEIKASADWIRQFEPGPWAFAYPYGGLSDDSPDLLQKHGFIAAFTTQTQMQHTNPYLIGRVDGEELAYNGRSYA
jgi:peptidoglycan/xylan/chitin deacetylase (PgdA/CDA1 family)